MTHHSRTVALLIGILAFPAFAQDGNPPKPVGQTHPAALPLERIATLDVPALDRNAIAAEDAISDANGFAPRFAIPFVVDVRPATHGTWEVLDNTWSLWRLRIRAPEASHVNLGFTGFDLPAAGRLMVYASDYRWIVRPFDARDNTPARELWTPVVSGSELVVELFVHTTDVPIVDLHLTHVGSGYRFFGAGESAVSLGPLGAGACNVDVVCPQGNGWRSEIPGIAAYSTGGSVFCTGFMVNNTAQDRRSFFQTAYHCGIRSNNAASIVVYWDYENTACAGPDNGQLNRFNTGSVLRAGWSTSDFTLVELNSSPNPAWGVTWVGWDHSGADATAAVGIHHPSGDPKKISFENQGTQTTSYLGTSVPGNGTHVRVIDWDIGTTEPGSSGSPLFDQNHHVIGQLHGGSAACGNDLSDYYGKFSRSWTGGGTSSTRLSDWLDPLSTTQLSLDTLGNTGIASAVMYGSGCIESFQSFSETFAVGGFDLSGNGVTPVTMLMTPQGSGYRVTNGSAQWYTPTSANLALGDDAESPALNLGFTLGYPGGSTAQVRIGSNGYVWLDGTSATADYTPTVAELVGEGPRVCPLWMDLDPTAAGSTHFDVAPGVAYCTWVGVREYGQTNAISVQCALFSDGRIELRWRQVTNITHVALVGFSPGGGALAPPQRDLSASLPFDTGLDAAGLTFTPNNRPVLGTSQSITVSSIHVGTTIGVVAIGFGKYEPGVDLGPIGMPTCRQYATIDVTSTFPGNVASHNFALAIPNDPSLAGAHVFASAITLTPGVNSLGLLTSNGVDLALDQN